MLRKTNFQDNRMQAKCCKQNTNFLIKKLEWIDNDEQRANVRKTETMRETALLKNYGATNCQFWWNLLYLCQTEEQKEKQKHVKQQRHSQIVCCHCHCGGGGDGGGGCVKRPILQYNDNSIFVSRQLLGALKFTTSHKHLQRTDKFITSHLIKSSNPFCRLSKIQSFIYLFNRIRWGIRCIAFIYMHMFGECDVAAAVTYCIDWPRCSSVSQPASQHVWSS